MAAQDVHRQIIKTREGFSGFGLAQEQEYTMCWVPALALGLGADEYGTSLASRHGVPYTMKFGNWGPWPAPSFDDHTTVAPNLSC